MSHEHVSTQDMLEEGAVSGPALELAWYREVGLMYQAARIEPGQSHFPVEIEGGRAFLKRYLDGEDGANPQDGTIPVELVVLDLNRYQATVCVKTPGAQDPTFQLIREGFSTEQIHGAVLGYKPLENGQPNDFSR